MSNYKICKNEYCTVGCNNDRIKDGLICNLDSNIFIKNLCIHTLNINIIEYNYTKTSKSYIETKLFNFLNHYNFYWNNK